MTRTRRSDDVDWLGFLFGSDRAIHTQLGERIRAVSLSRMHSHIEAKNRLAQLGDDLCRVALVTRALAELMLSKNLITREEFEQALAQADLADGVADGKVEPQLVKPGSKRAPSVPAPMTPKPAPKPGLRPGRL